MLVVLKPTFVLNPSIDGTFASGGALYLSGSASIAVETHSVYSHCACLDHDLLKVIFENSALNIVVF